MRLRRLGLLLAIAALPSTGRAGPLEPGYYAVVCEMMAHASTAKAALRLCAQKTRREKARHPHLSADCDCARHGDVVYIATGRAPAYFVAPGGQMARTKAAAIAACDAEQRAYAKRNPTLPPFGWDCSGGVLGAYGPFTRKRTRAEFDDAQVYTYLLEDGRWADADGLSVCLAAGTLVSTPDGDRPIETVAAGDSVVSWSAERGERIAAEVVRVKQRRTQAILTVRLADGRSLRLTGNHLVFAPARAAWIPASELRAGDAVAVLSGETLAPVEISEITARSEAVDVFDLTVEPTHSYFAGGVWVHNY
jgi:hypothetical protein